MSAPNSIASCQKLKLRSLTEDERAELFSDADYNQLMGVLDDLQAESIAMYNEYVNQINAVNVEEAYS